MTSAAPTIPPEVEAKLLVPRASDLRAMAEIGLVGTHRLQARGALRLRSVYLDTPDLTLARQAVALRLRRADGLWEATAKWPGRVDGLMHERPELTVPLSRAPHFPFALPDGPLRVHLTALVAGRPLAPILVTEIHRRQFDVVASDQTDPVAELALDDIHLRAPGQRKAALRYCEAEIELRHGRRRDIEDLAHWLQQRFDLTPSRESKYARGLAVLHGAALAETRLSALRLHDTLGDATRKIVAWHLGRLREHDPGTRVGADPEALHDMRVASRRLRAVVRAFEDGVPRQVQASLNRELRWLGQVLGSVRDLDVHLGLLDQYRTAVPADHRDGLATFRAHIEAERTRCRSAMLSQLDSVRYFRLLIRLERFARGQAARRAPFKEPVAHVGRRAIRRAFRRVRKDGQRIGETPTDAELHALRIRVKRLRYLLEFLRELTGKPGRQLVKDTIRLQDLLGLHHDATVAAEFIRRYVEGAGAQSNASSMLALGAFVGAQLQRADKARADFRKAWQRFARRRTSNNLRAVLERLRDETPPPRPVAAAAGDR